LKWKKLVNTMKEIDLIIKNIMLSEPEKKRKRKNVVITNHEFIFMVNKVRLKYIKYMHLFLNMGTGESVCTVKNIFKICYHNIFSFVKSAQ